jgi:hypothetical protein
MSIRNVQTSIENVTALIANYVITENLIRFAVCYGTKISSRINLAKLEQLIRFISSDTEKNYLRCKTSYLRSTISVCAVSRKRRLCSSRQFVTSACRIALSAHLPNCATARRSIYNKVRRSSLLKAADSASTGRNTASLDWRLSLLSSSPSPFLLSRS